MIDAPALVVLAAGASLRLGRPKALAVLRPGPLGSALALLLRAGACLADPGPLVVTGRDHARIAAHLARAGLRAELVPNPDWAAGRSGSARCAAAHRPGRDLCLAPLDVPLVPSEVFASLAEAWQRAGAPPRGWLGPHVMEGAERRFGHPVVLGRALLEDLQDFPPDAPLSLLRARAAPLLAQAVASRAILDDLDTPADLARLRARSARPFGPRR